MTSTPTSARAHTLAVPDATLYYEVRGAGPLVVLAGAPMGAADFASAAQVLAEAGYTVVTTDPRGHHRSLAHDPDQDSTPRARGADLAAILSHSDAGPAAVFGSSGGAVSALALAQQEPDLVHTVIAHEPPLIDLLEDRERLYRGTCDLVDTYLGGDTLGGWRMFFAQAGIALPEPVLADMFGGDRDPVELAGERFWFAHEILGTVTWEPDVTALTGADTRVIVGVGADSAGQLCDRTSRALAHRLGTDPVEFPGGHTGFLDDAPTFATRLREVLGD